MAKILGAVAYDPGTRVQKSTSALLAMTAFDTTNARITFTAPASGKAFWRVACFHRTGRTPDYVLLGVLESTTVRARQACAVTTATSTGDVNLSTEASGVISGLTGGNSYTFDAAYGVENASTAGTLEYGGPDNATADDASGALIYEIWELIKRPMGQATTTKAISTTQVADGFPGKPVTVYANDLTSTTENKTVQVDGETDGAIATYLSNYTYDPDYGKTDNQKALEVGLPATAEQKIREVFTQNPVGSSFTATERDRVLAFIALKLNGR